MLNIAAFFDADPYLARCRIPGAALRSCIVDAVFIGCFVALLLALRALIAGCAVLEKKQ
jgi:hypothetical protein